MYASIGSFSLRCLRIIVWMFLMRYTFRRLRSEIDKLLGSDRILCLVVAIETALADERYEVRTRRCSLTDCALNE